MRFPGSRLRLRERGLRGDRQADGELRPFCSLARFNGVRAGRERRAELNFKWALLSN